MNEKYRKNLLICQGRKLPSPQKFVPEQGLKFHPAFNPKRAINPSVIGKRNIVRF